MLSANQGAEQMKPHTLLGKQIACSRRATVWRHLIMKFYVYFYHCRLVTKSCPTLLRPHRLWRNRLLYPWDFSGKNTGVGCHFLLQGIFQTQGMNLHLLHGHTDSLPQNHLSMGSQRVAHDLVTEWQKRQHHGSAISILGIHPREIKTFIYIKIIYYCS